MSLQVASLSFEMVAAIRPLLARIKRCDRSLADQLVRAASSVALKIAEAEYSDPGNKRARLFTAAGSANETRAALRLGVAWGYYAERDAGEALVLVGRVVAMLWGLTRRYSKSKMLDSRPYEGRGTKLFQLASVGGVWKIASLSWYDEALV